MKKISVMLMALVLTITMSATVVTFDFTSASELTAMGVNQLPAKSQGWNLTGQSLMKDGVTLTGVKNTNTDNRVWNSNGNYDFRSYKNNTLTFTVTGGSVIKGLIFNGTANFLDVENNRYVCNDASVTITATATATLKSVKVYVDEDMPSLSIDTISVTEARQRIDAQQIDPCYIKGVVVSAPFDPTGAKKYAVWLTDVDNPTDSLEGFWIRKGKESTNLYADLDAMAKDFGILDTVLIFADGITLYTDTTGKQLYETTSGCFVKTLGKSAVVYANSIFKFGVGARQWGAAFDGERYKYELILSETGDEDYENALHLIINTNVARGIAGSYVVKNSQNDSSYVDGEGPVSGSVELDYVEEASQVNNKYNVKATFVCNGRPYILDTVYNLSGLDFDTYEQFKLSDDVPYVPKEGDTLTCAEAKKYALSVLAENETSKVNVVIIGYANNVGNVSENQQTFYLDDESAGTAKIIQSYWGNLTNLKQVTNGAKVLLYGKLMHYVSGSDHVAEIKNGDVVVLEGGEPFERDITLEPVPDGAITVAEAKQLADQLGANDTSDVVIVKGYVTSLYNSYNTKYKSQSFYMNDVNDPNSKSYFEAFQCGLAAPTMVGDFVWVEGRLVKYIKENGEVNYNLVKGNGHFDTLSTDLVKVMNNMPQNSVQKVFYKGNIYIVRDGVIRNVHGAVIR